MNLGLLSRWRDRDDDPAGDRTRAGSDVEASVGGSSHRPAVLQDALGAGQPPSGTTRRRPRSTQGDMALVPGGLIALGAPQGIDEDHQIGEFEVLQSVERETVEVPAFYLDRTAVSNNDYGRFVAAGGYDDMELWPEEIWPSVLQFVDGTGSPGPRFWVKGRPPRGKDQHPVVGVSWYEARAFARWAGKRLPTAVEWEKAASWPADLSGRGPKVRYPWGNSFSPDRANTWLSGRGGTVGVEEYPDGCAPNGIFQLAGNVWEWLEDRYDGPLVPEGIHVQLEHDMRQVRGGAFDTYFEIEATCHFCTGQPELDRRDNVGFRCARDAE